MPWSETAISTLTLPQSAGPNDARIVITATEIPAPLQTFYGGHVVAALLFYDTAGEYIYIALTFSGLFMALVIGSWDTATIEEMAKYTPNSRIVYSTDLVYEDASGNATLGGWQALPLAGLWANLGGGFVPAEYRTLASPSRELELVGHITGGASADNSLIATLPAGSRPISRVRREVAPAITTANRTAYFDVLTNGEVRCFNMTGSADVSFGFTIPLDL